MTRTQEEGTMFWRLNSKRETDQRLMIADLLPTPVMAIDRELRVTYVNRAAAQIAGRTAESCVGLSCADVLRAEHCGTGECPCRQAMDRQQVFTADQTARPQGREIPIRYTATPLRSESGHVVGALEFVLDISKEVEISRAVQELSGDALAGRLQQRLPADRFQGNYRNLVQAVNSMLDAVLAPVGEATKVLERVADRDLSARMTGQYQGDHARLQTSLNHAVENLDDSLEQIASAVEQVAAAADQIGSGSQTLAQGAS
jgi:methyl-accepting chemotaxis protein